MDADLLGTETMEPRPTAMTRFVSVPAARWCSCTASTGAGMAQDGAGDVAALSDGSGATDAPGVGHPPG